MKYRLASLVLLLLAAMNIVAILQLVMAPSGPTPEQVEAEIARSRAQNLVPELDAVGSESIEGQVEAMSESEYVFTGTITVVNAQSVPINDAIVTFQFITGSDIQIIQARTNGRGLADVEVFFSDQGTFRLEILDITGEGIQFSPEVSNQINFRDSV